MTRVLIVENNQPLLTSTAESLRAEGFEVHTAVSEAEALKILSQHLIHLAMVDIRLRDDQDENDDSGIKLCRKIGSSVARIVLTGARDWHLVRDALDPTDTHEPDAEAYLHKSESTETWLREIRRVLAAHYEVLPDRRIAILTSGGDAPGMNAAIWAALRSALTNNIEIDGIHDGYRGLIDGRIEKLKWLSVLDALTTGGTLLGSARCKEFHQEGPRTIGAQHLIDRHVDGLILIGGDGSMNGALALAKTVKKLGSDLQTIALPGTIDNDLFGTDMSIGAASAVTAIMHEINNMVAPARALRRIFVCEIMGRNSGFLTLEAGLCIGAEAMLLPEELIVVPDDKLEAGDWQDQVRINRTREALMCRLEEVSKRLENEFAAGKRHAFILFAEGIRLLTKDQITLQFVADTLSDYLKDWTSAQKPDVRPQVIGYPTRGVPPSRSDVHLGTLLGAAAVEALLAGDSERMLGWSEAEGRVVKTPFAEVVARSNRPPSVKYRDSWRATVELQKKLITPPAAFGQPK